MEQFNYRMPLPWWVKPIALWSAPVSVILMISLAHWEMQPYKEVWLTMLLYVALLAREHDEDERIKQLRLEAMFLTILTAPAWPILSALYMYSKGGYGDFPSIQYPAVLLSYHLIFWLNKRIANKKAKLAAQCVSDEEPGA